MPPKPFYDVNPKTYLFEKNERPEEKVRQWVLFELLSTYGININDIQVEVPVKMGSKKFSADIVVSNSHSPFVVIECKEETKEVKDALDQAISYANYLGTSFAVATNGHEWLVQRKQYGEWVSVIDLSRPIQGSPERDLNYLFWYTDRLKPLLFWVYKQVPAKNAQRFMSLLNQTFEYCYEDFANVDSNLYEALVALLRVTSWGEFIKPTSFDDDGESTSGRIDEIIKAYKHSRKFLNQHGLELEMMEKKDFSPFRMSPEEQVYYLGIELGKFAKQNNGLVSNTTRLLRLTASIAQYLATTAGKKKYQDIPEKLTQELFAFIDPYLLEMFNVVIPDHLDELIIDFYSTCEIEWQRVTKDDNVSDT